MSKRIPNLFFVATLALGASVWLSRAAQAGPATVCGNGQVETGEMCDDGAQCADGTTTCDITNPGNTCQGIGDGSCGPRGGDGCDVNCDTEVCGNGVTQPALGETCDDGNTVAGDGCDANCHLECGNGVVDTGEACDDGATCSDGTTVCDLNNPGNTCAGIGDGSCTAKNGDGCDNDVSNGGNCTATACGNGVVTPPEQCDDGNTVNDDSCTNDCKFPTVALDPKEQVCVKAVNGNWAGVVKAQDADNSACVKSVASGKAAVADCLGKDVKGKVAKAQAKTTATTSGKKCTGDGDVTQPDDFAFSDAATVNASASGESLNAFTFIFGATPNVVAKSADKAGAACQAEVVKDANKLTETFTKVFNKNKAKLIKSSKTVPGVAGPTELAAGEDTAIAADQSITKAENKVNSGIAKRCPDAIVDGLFDCNAATTGNALAVCVIASAKDAACRSAEAADKLDLTCPDVLPDLP